MLQILFSNNKKKTKAAAASDNEYENEEEGEQMLLGTLPATSDPDERISETVLGPMVNNTVRGMLDTENGRGSLAFNADGKWDGVNIWQTLAWPTTCKYGKLQSPVHVNVDDRFQLEANSLSFAYKSPSQVYLENDGYKLVVAGEQSGAFGHAFYGSHLFYVDEIYIHHPSEHTLGENQERSEYEIQILHSDAFGLKIMVSIMLSSTETDDENVFLNDLGFNNPQRILSGSKSSVAQAINLSSLVANADQFIEYEGSLTSPPCSEGVRWFLLNERGSVSTSQVTAFKDIFGKDSNVRGVQPLNSRVFSLFSS